MAFDVQNEDDFVPISVAVRVCPPQIVPELYYQNCVQVRPMAHILSLSSKS